MVSVAQIFCELFVVAGLVSACAGIRHLAGASRIEKRKVPATRSLSRERKPSGAAGSGRFLHSKIIDMSADLKFNC